MIRCKIKLTDGTAVKVALPENSPKELLKWLNAPSSGDTKERLGDFILSGKVIFNRHQIVKIEIEDVEDGEEIDMEKETTEMETHLHKEKNPNGPPMFDLNKGKK